MKITLVVTNPSGKNLVFLTNSLHALSLAEAIGKAKTNSFNNLFVVNGTYGEYLRAIRFAIERGEQIADEFYTLVTKWLKS